MSVYEPSDGVAEEVERHVQLALGAAALAAQRMIEARRQAIAEAQTRSQAAVAQLRAQQTRERALAAARVQAVHDDRWWQTADPPLIADMTQTVEAWRDPSFGNSTDFDAAHARMEQEVNARWGLDLSQVAALATADDARWAPHVAATVNHNRELDSFAGVATGHDTVGRRSELHDRLTTAGVPDDATQARVLADTAQAAPVAAAVSSDVRADQTPVRSHARSLGRAQQRTH